MAWSTRQLADLAGTTVKTVRHYHRIGLLDEPERAHNGYKQYRTHHLVELLRIRRLTELGASLSQIATITDSTRAEAVDELDRGLRATIAELERARADLATLRYFDAPLDVPPGFGPVADRLGDDERAVLLVCSRLLGERTLDDLRVVVADRTAVDDEFAALAADADDAVIADLAPRMARQIHDDQQRFPWLLRPAAGSDLPEAVAAQTLATVLAERYNPAQWRALVAADDLVRRMREPSGPTPQPGTPARTAP